MEDLNARLDEAIEESFPASDPIALTPDPTPWDNKEASRFELDYEDKPSIIDYKRGKRTIALIHTEVPEEFRGHNFANILAKFALDTARAEDLKVLPYCPFIKVYLKRHPEYADLVTHEEE
ncbi:MAG: N-acetyltransferase [Armatimonadetes bacterium]|nr:N-acetyltransferase [Armatimonadota bacterium]